MNKLLFLLLLFTNCLFLTVNSKEFINNFNNKRDIVRPDSLPDRDPSFPGGQDSLKIYLTRELHYPKSAKKYGVEGRVITEFTVTKKGKLKNIYLLRSIFPDCDDEAIFLIKTMPKWIPGIRNGKKVNLEVILPIEFNIKNSLP